MNSMRKILYNCVPVSWRRTLGSSTLLKPLRDILFRKNGTYIETVVTVKRDYLDYTVQFTFYASLQVSSKAAAKGMENTLLRNSMVLVNRYKLKKEGCTVMDVGTNFGYLSLVWARTLAKEGTVISFEPHPEMFASFSRSVAANALQAIIQPVNKAVGEKPGEIDIHLAHTSANTLPLKSERKERNLLTIPMTTIDHYAASSGLTHCDLIKIDVDGIEKSILKGAVYTLHTFRPIVIVETNDDREILEFMEKQNYTLLDARLQLHTSIETIPPNAFFVPSELYKNAV